MNFNSGKEDNDEIIELLQSNYILKNTFTCHICSKKNENGV